MDVRFDNRALVSSLYFLQAGRLNHHGQGKQAPPAGDPTVLHGAAIGAPSLGQDFVEQRVSLLKALAASGRQNAADRVHAPPPAPLPVVRNDAVKAVRPAPVAPDAPVDAVRPGPRHPFLSGSYSATNDPNVFRFQSENINGTYTILRNEKGEQTGGRFDGTFTLGGKSTPFTGYTTGPGQARFVFHENGAIFDAEFRAENGKFEIFDPRATNFVKSPPPDLIRGHAREIDKEHVAFSSTGEGYGLEGIFNRSDSTFEVDLKYSDGRSYRLVGRVTGEGQATARVVNPDGSPGTEFNFNFATEGDQWGVYNIRLGGGQPLPVPPAPPDDRAKAVIVTPLDGGVLQALPSDADAA